MMDHKITIAIIVIALGIYSIKNRQNVQSMQIIGTTAIVNAELNTYSMQFVLDTGCSGITISKHDFATLKQAHVLEETDYIGTTECTNASDHVDVNPTYLIRNVTICGKTVHNIECYVTNSSIRLLGNSVLQQLQDVEVDYKNKEIRVLN